jgi:hypothetical protein
LPGADDDLRLAEQGADLGHHQLLDLPGREKTRQAGYNMQQCEGAAGEDAEHPARAILEVTGLAERGIEPPSSGASRW